MKIKNYKNFVLESNQSLTTDKQIIKWLDKMGIINYTITPDFTIDVNMGVTLMFKDLNYLPWKFNIVNGDFSCIRNNLTSLMNCPNIVKGDFNYMDNKITTLKYFPKQIYGDCLLSQNKLKTLNGLSHIHSRIVLINNPLTTLNGLNIKYDLRKLQINLDKSHLYWTWLESNLTTDPSLIEYNIPWIKENISEIPKSFEEKFGHLIEIYNYTK